MKLLVASFLVLCVAFTGAVLNIHVVPHTHDDVGWLKTVDEYYYGANQSIQDAGVQYIIDNVIYSLQQNPARKFIYVEMAFFWRWWREQNDEMRGVVKQLVASGQLEFINGGWTMHDEAAVHFEDQVDQMTLGHQFLYNTFGIVPKIGWQLDPFGHSATNAIVDSLSGFEALFFARMDYQDLATRAQDRGLEMWWNPSQSDPNITLLTGMMWGGYCSPNGFMFEYGDQPIMDDPNLENFNIPAKAENFVQQAFFQASLLRHNDIMFSWGCDFMYENAHMMYKNIEKLMDYINANSSYYNVSVFYSTPSLYAQAILKENPPLPVKHADDDFMPYADGAHSYWTGYFVSRSTLKGYVRYSSHINHAITALVSASQIQSDSIQEQIFQVQEPNGVTTHHDAVTGTEQQHVADDYALRLTTANNAAYEIFSEVIGQIISPKAGPQFSFCPLMNETICPASSSVTKGILPIVVYNPLGWANTDYVKVPVSTSTVSVVDNNGNPVSAQVVPGFFAGTYTVIFSATIPPLGFSTYFVQVGQSSSSTEQSSVSDAGTPFSFSNQHLKVNFDGEGNLQSVVDLSTHEGVALNQEYFYYISNPGDSVSSQASGAYIFRPLYQTPTPFAQNIPHVSVINGSSLMEVRRYFQDDLSQVIRLFAGQNYIEIEDIVGPINITNGQGKEVITRYTMNFTSQNTWYSDSNGIELLERKLNYRPSWNFTVEEPVSGNYVPVDAITSIKDFDTGLQLAVVVDRSRSSASLANGELEMMLHRRCLVDDGRGVGEPLNESTIMASKEWLVITNSSRAASVYRPLAKRAYHPFVLAFGPTTTSVSSWTSQYKTTFAPLGITLPSNVQLLDFVPLGGGAYIFRLHHIFQVGEDAQLSLPVTVDIANLLSNYKISAIEETQLTGVAASTRPDAIHLQAPITTAPVRLQPTEIRTFIVSYQVGASSAQRPGRPSVHIV